MVYVTGVAELSHRERFILEAVHGWLLLNNPVEARRELSEISLENRGHPEVLLKEWEIHAHLREWETAIEISERVIARAPESPEGYVKRAFALHELRRTQEAWDCLLPLTASFQEQWLIPYNLACYACQLGREEDALHWLKRALRIGDEEQIRSMALEDADLIPIRAQIPRLSVANK